MPGFDQTGPIGNGPRTGRGAGRCLNVLDKQAGGTASGYGLGRGGRPSGCGMGRGAGMRNAGRGQRGQFFGSDSVQDETMQIQEELSQARERIRDLEIRLANLKSNPTG